MIWVDTKELRFAAEALILASRMARDAEGLRLLTAVDPDMAFRAVKGALAMLLDASVVEEGTHFVNCKSGKTWP